MVSANFFSFFFSMSISQLKALVQQQIDMEQENLRGLVSAAELRSNGGLEVSMHLSKGTLRVYYAFLQGDKDKCLAAINAVRKTCHEALEGIMDETTTSFVAVTDLTISTWTSEDYIGLNKPSENARQLAQNLKMRMDNFKLLYENL